MYLTQVEIAWWECHEEEEQYEGHSRKKRNEVWDERGPDGDRRRVPGSGAS